MSSKKTRKRKAPKRVARGAKDQLTPVQTAVETKPNQSEPVTLGSEAEEQIKLLRAAIEIGSGFELFFVASDSRVTLDEVRQSLQHTADKGTKTHLSWLHFDNPEQLTELTERLIAVPSDPGQRILIWVSTDGIDDEQRAGWSRGLALLNERRNLLVKECPQAIVLAGPTWLPVVASDVAPDAWSVRSSVFVLPSAVWPASADWTDQEQRRYLWELRDHELAPAEHYRQLADALGASPRQAEQATRARLLHQAAHVHAMRGEPDVALDTLELAKDIWAKLGNEHGRASVLGEIARILFSKGLVDEATKLHQEKLGIVERIGSQRERAVSLFDIARILFSQGKIDEAMKLYQETLGIFEQLGDTRSRAVALGDIAQVLRANGQVDEAMKLHQERLQVFEAIGDASERAHTLWRMGQIELSRANIQDGLAYLRKSHNTYIRLDNQDGICQVGLDLAQLLVSSGETGPALEILTRSRDGFFQLGQADLATQAQGLIDKLQK